VHHGVCHTSWSRSPTSNPSQPANHLSIKNGTGKDALNPQTSQEASEPRPCLQDASEVRQTKNPPSNYPVESIYDVGHRYSESLRRIGVETVGDVARITDIDEFEESLGIPAAVLHKIRLRALIHKRQNSTNRISRVPRRQINLHRHRNR
jgi:hypothetical protein